MGTQRNLEVAVLDRGLGSRPIRSTLVSWKGQRVRGGEYIPSALLAPVFPAFDAAVPRNQAPLIEGTTAGYGRKLGLPFVPAAAHGGGPAGGGARAAAGLPGTAGAFGHV